MLNVLVMERWMMWNAMQVDRGGICWTGLTGGVRDRLRVNFWILLGPVEVQSTFLLKPRHCNSERPWFVTFKVPGFCGHRSRRGVWVIFTTSTQYETNVIFVVFLSSSFGPGTSCSGWFVLWLLLLEHLLLYISSLSEITNCLFPVEEEWCVSYRSRGVAVEEYI